MQNGCNNFKKTYLKNVTVTNYNIDRKMLDKVIKKIQINQPLRSIISFIQPTNSFLLSTTNMAECRPHSIVYKLYSSCIHQCLMDHVYKKKKNIVTPEQAPGKKRVCGTIEQLIINKSTLKEVRSMRRNLVAVWLNYRKAFDLISHNWFLHTLKFTKLSNHLIMAIKNLTKSWWF